MTDNDRTHKPDGSGPRLDERDYQFCAFGKDGNRVTGHIFNGGANPITDKESNATVIGGDNSGQSPKSLRLH
jgi:hypothetical protein